MPTDDDLLAEVLYGDIDPRTRDLLAAYLAQKGSPVATEVARERVLVEALTASVPTPQPR